MSSFRMLLVLPLALLAAVLCAACETVVEVPMPPHERQLVAQGFFTAESLWVVRVSHTVGYTAAEAPGMVDDAVVEVWEGGQRLIDLARQDSGTYVATGRGPNPGKTYTLRVSAPGYAPTEGRDALPILPPVHAFGETPMAPPDSLSRRRRTHVEITLEDPPGARNFYGLLVFQLRAREDRRPAGQITPLPPMLFPFESDDPAFGESELDFIDTEKILYREAFFGDELFDGRRYTLDFDVQYDAPAPEADFVIRRAFAVVLFSVTEDFYRYWNTASRQMVTGVNPFAEPLRVHSNLTAGFGVFAGFQYRIYGLGAGGLSLGSGDLGGYGLADLCDLVGAQLPICGVGAVLPQ